MSKHIKGDWLLYLVWVVVLILVVIVSLTHELESTNFFGITETREIVVSSENSVEIKNIYVVEGQSVVQGQELVELNSPELMIKINQISHQLDELKAQKGVNKNELISKISQLNAEKQAITSEINNNIRQLENQFNINKELTSELKSIPSYERTEGSTTSNPIYLEIESLKQELTLSITPIDIQIELSQALLDASESPIKIQVERLQKELALLEQERSNLTIYAQISGMIGSVFFKVGEKVAHHTPILTLHTKNPTLIKGYIYEDVYTQIDVGMDVNVTSLTDSKAKIFGSVVGVGSRIVEYPVRLRKHPDIQLWGREIMIKIPTVNSLILGEKVLINIPATKKSYSKKHTTLQAREIEIQKDSPLTASFELNQKLCGSCTLFPIQPRETQNIEASAALFLPDLDRFVVLSDDIPNNKPLMLLMNDTGTITDEILINGLNTIDDMESIAQGEDGSIYIASSMSVNAKGNLKDARKLLIKVKRNGKEFSLEGKVDLYLTLMNAAQKSKNANWSKFIIEAADNESLDLEGMAFNDGALYLGFKSPLFLEQAVILKISDIDDLFTNGTLTSGQISIWKMLRLAENKTSAAERLTGLHFVNDELFITSSGQSDQPKNKSGSVWRSGKASSDVDLLAKFSNLKPEGISATAKDNSLLICFDQGSKHLSQIALLEVLR